MCGTDAARVLAEPAGALEQPAEPERGTLERMGFDGHGETCRLLCSARVRTGKVTVLGDAVTD